VVEGREQHRLTVARRKGKRETKRGAPNGELALRKRGRKEWTDFYFQKERVDTANQTGEVCFSSLRCS
ncbi:MAG: hypothetical protein KF895_15575, partial [Parvibaculum sp.]|nr:hypothetical protein [Parvibaculum sp.]